MESALKKRAPGPPWYSVPKRVLKILSHPLSALTKEFQKFGDIFRLEFGPVNLHFVGHPDYINHILVKHSQNYSRLTQDYLSMQSFLGEGLLTTEGKVWQR